MLVVSGQPNCHDTDNKYTAGQPFHNTVQLVFLKPIEDYVSGERLDVCYGKEWQLHTFTMYDVAHTNSDCFGMRARATKLA
jgi:hypothetical protein